MNVGRVLRVVNVLFGLALLVAPFVLDAGTAQSLAGIVAGLALMGLSLPRGKVRSHYGNWDRMIV